MKVNFRKRMNESDKTLLEKTYTVGDTQYWKRNGKYLKWTEGGGKTEISQDEYFKALSGGEDAPVKVKRELPKISNYNDASDEDLALLASSGDSKATEILVKKYEPLVHKITNKYFLMGGDKDDLDQSGRIGIWDGIRYYDPDKNDNFFKYISTAIENKVRSAVASGDTQRNQPLNTYTSFDKPVGSEGDGGERTIGDTIAGSKSPEEIVLGRDGAQRLLHFMKTELTLRERDAIFRFINGEKIPEIAQSMNVSYKSIENAIQRAKGKIAEYKKKDDEELQDNNKVHLTLEESTIIKSILDKINKSSLNLKDLDETEFSYDGKNYKSKFGKYSCDGEDISKEDYHKARKAFLDSEEDSPIDSMLNRTNKKIANEVDDLEHYVNTLDYDKDTDVSRSTRSGHLPRLDKDDIKDRVKVIMEETGMDEDEAKMVNKAISRYTITDQVKLTDDERNALNDYLDKAPVYKTDKPLYRGLGFKDTMDNQYYDLFKDIEIGKLVEFRDFTSFTSNPDVAINFAESNGENSVILINTRNLTGVSIDHLSSIDYAEDELLYKADAKMVVRDKSVDDKSIFIHVEEMKLDEADYDEDSITVLPIEGSMCSICK